MSPLITIILPCHSRSFRPKSVCQQIILINPSHPVRAQAVLKQMEPLLATDDTAVGDLFAANQQQRLAMLGTGALQLQRQVQSFDYPAALVTVGALMR